MKGDKVRPSRSITRPQATELQNILTNSILQFWLQTVKKVGMTFLTVCAVCIEAHGFFYEVFGHAELIG